MVAIVLVIPSTIAISAVAISALPLERFLPFMLLPGLMLLIRLLPLKLFLTLVIPIRSTAIVTIVNRPTELHSNLPPLRLSLGR
jgi:hypothetical protein